MGRKQIGFGVEGFRLDKDILFKGNKLYSEETCVFVPHQINSLLVNVKRARGNYPIGVHFSKSAGKFIAQCSVKGKRLHLGVYNTEQAAFEAYKAYKEDVLKLLANEYKDVIDERVYSVLLNYNVEITD